MLELFEIDNSALKVFDQNGLAISGPGRYVTVDTWFLFCLKFYKMKDILIRL